MKFKKLGLVCLVSIMFGQVFAQKSMIKPLTKKPFEIGETIEIHSKILGENRKLNIYLPVAYSPDSVKKYPVIYLLDGSAEEDFIHIAGLVQFCSFTWIKMIPETIVVGIANVDRKRDFTFPTSNKKDKEDFPTTGGSARFISFLQHELQPFIDTQYKTDQVKTLIGQSLGGLLATEILLKKPELFDNYIIVSPSLWWDDESLLKGNEASFASNKSVFIAVGKEGEVMEQDAKKLFDKLKSKSAENPNLYFDFLGEQNHGDALHLAVYHAFEKLFAIP